MFQVLRSGVFAGVGISVLTVCSAAHAADLPAKAPLLPIHMPAVDGVNSKWEGFGGSASHESFYGGAGSVSVPLGYQFGLQLDGLAASYRGDTLGAVGAHAFWRNPAQGLLGIYGSYSHLDRLGGINVGRIGAEGALYHGRFTLEGMVGAEFGNSASATVGTVIETIDVKTRFFDRIDAAYYLTDDLKLAVGHRYYGGKNTLALSGEWGFNIPSTVHMGAAFVEGRIGNSDSNSVWAGLRVYLGQKSKSLIRRHREDDPPNPLGEEGSTFSGSGSTSPAPAPTIVCTPPAILIGGVCRLPT